MFLEKQGYSIEENKSDIIMETNGRNSCNGNSRYINICYLFIKDRILKGEVKVEYCWTRLMLEDYFTNPLMGERLHDFRNVIMG